MAGNGGENGNDEHGGGNVTTKHLDNENIHEESEDQTPRDLDSGGNTVTNNTEDRDDQDDVTVNPGNMPGDGDGNGGQEAEVVTEGEEGGAGGDRSEAVTEVESVEGAEAVAGDDAGSEDGDGGIETVTEGGGGGDHDDEGSETGGDGDEGGESGGERAGGGGPPPHKKRRKRSVPQNKRLHPHSSHKYFNKQRLRRGTLPYKVVDVQKLRSKSEQSGYKHSLLL